MKIKELTIILWFLFPCGLVAQKASTWKNLFNGRNLDGWTKLAGTAEYEVIDSAIVGISVMGSPNTFLVSDTKVAGDFILEMEVMLEDSLINSGVQFKSNFDSAGLKGKGMVYGYQFELDPSPRKWSGGIYDERRRGWLYPVSLHPEARQIFTTGIYHKIRIECIGNTTKTWLDGKPVSYLVDTLKDNEGLIGLQVHSISSPIL